MAVRVDLVVAHLDDERWRPDFHESVVGGRGNYFRVNAVTVPIFSTPTLVQLPHAAAPRLVFMKNTSPSGQGILVARDSSVNQPFILLAPGEFAILPMPGTSEPVFYAKTIGSASEALLVVIWDGWTIQSS